MGINETIADTRHWITEHKLKAIGKISGKICQFCCHGHTRPFVSKMMIVRFQVAYGAQEFWVRWHFSGPGQFLPH